jgi:hypothetical protein
MLLLNKKVDNFWGLLLAPSFEGYLIPPVLNSDVTVLTLQTKKGKSFLCVV